MKLLFLGTGAAGLGRVPESEVAEGGRRCTSVLIDDTVLVDVSLQSFDYLVKLGKDPSAITDILLSHAHFDHFNREALMQFVSAAKSKLRFWCHKGAVGHLGLTDEDMRAIDLRTVDICDAWETADLRVTALPANHLVGDLKSAEVPLHYIFEKGGKRVFYGCDGGWYTAVEWEYLLQNAIKLDAVIMDATVGEDAGNFRIGTHNNIAMIKLLTLALRQNGLLSDNAFLIATHFSRSCYPANCSHKEIFEPLGMIAAEDGVEMII